MISLVIPTYNEAENIKKLIPQVSRILKKDYEIVIVDDDSPDKTWKIAQGMKRYNVRVIRRVKERGLATAVIRGFKEARGDIITVMDADMSHPPKVLAKMASAIKNNDIVIASRYVKGGGLDMSRRRKNFSKIATLLARPLTSVKDPMTGFFCFRKEVIKDAGLKPIGFKILLDVLVKGRYKKVKEVPFYFTKRFSGESKLGSRVIFDYIRHLTKLYAYKLFYRKR